ncbi:hypothetical protein GcC1_026021 [Golovinomyces cichoracearum]|uniref:Uncharacterized protein n=1 Tax=Golovinomyces cichoracearum TaxID=62708 RepID=A0A420J3L8_9PEZI|nr:hypothetical protein GcC1_026021 [Golovinomyces cichoracearum]
MAKCIAKGSPYYRQWLVAARRGVASELEMKTR